MDPANVFGYSIRRGGGNIGIELGIHPKHPLSLSNTENEELWLRNNISYRKFTVGNEIDTGTRRLGTGASNKG